MTPLVVLLAVAALFLAYANGANDNFKGVATLYGSGTLSYPAALTWATLTTAAGSLCSLFLAARLARAFSAKGLVPEAVAVLPDYLTAVACGAAVTVFLATLRGWPVSTTHSLVGALAGAGVMAAGTDVNLSRLGGTFFLPLLVSPFLAMALAALLYLGLRRIRPARSRGERRGLDTLHVLSAGAVSFARGLNDTPKIAGLLLVLPAVSPALAVSSIALLMAIGGVAHARRVGETVGRRITAMNHGQGATANLVTSFLVILASRLGLPVSTTHVACSSLFGLGLSTGRAHPAVIGRILVAWVATLPVSAAVAAAVWSLLRLAS